MGLLAISATLVTCTVEEVRKAEPVTPPVSVEKRNPYSVEIVAKALNNVVARSGGRIQVVVPSHTHNYVRFEPQNLNQIKILQDLGYELWDEPVILPIFRPRGLGS